MKKRVINNGSHPPSLYTVVRNTLSPISLNKVLLAVSGGRDSIAMMHVMSRLSDELGFELHAHGVDHGLRHEAIHELKIASNVAEQCGIYFSIGRVSLAKGGNLQARAREVRYDNLFQKAKEVGASCVATAHHFDDRAETVIMAIMRGCGVDGLGVLPVLNEDSTLLRPLIRCTRRIIDDYIARQGLPYSNDPSNSDDRFLRTRVRHELLPGIREMSPNISLHLNNLADEAQERKENWQKSNEH